MVNVDKTLVTTERGVPAHVVLFDTTNADASEVTFTNPVPVSTHV